jgi:type II secretory pathway component PulF
MAEDVEQQRVRRRVLRRRPGSGPGRTRASGSSARRRPPFGRVRGGGGRGIVRPWSRRKEAATWPMTKDQLDLIAGLLDAGVSIEGALDTLARMSPDRATRAAAAASATQVRSGRRLSVALRDLGVPPAVSVLIAGAEHTGRTAEALRGAGEFLGRAEQLRTVMRRAATYPMVVLGVGLIMLTVISVIVVPPLERTFVALGGELPLPTRIVLRSSAASRSPWMLGAAAAVLLARGPILALSARIPVAAVLDRTPLVRRVREDLGVSLVARLCSSMLDAGVSLVDALRVAADALPPGGTQQCVAGAGRAVEEGRSALDEDGLGPLLDVAEREILAVAERTGLLAEQWRRVAERRSIALEGRVARLGSVMEPLLVVVIGLVVGGAVVALYLPTFRVLELL